MSDQSPTHDNKNRDPAPNHRRRAARLFVWTGGIVAATAIAWGVTHALDSGSRALEDEPPVKIYLETDPARVYAGQPEWQTYDFVSPSTLTTPPAPASSRCRDWRIWAHRFGAVDADETTAYLYVQARPDTAVVIDGLEVEVTSRREPLRGPSGHCAAGGAVGNPRLIDINLDRTPPGVLYAEAGDDYPARRRILFRLRGSETETLQLRAHTRRCDCSWRARLHLVVDGEPHEITVDENGKSFRTSASRAAVRHLQWNEDRWRPMSRSDWRHTLPVNWQAFARQQS
jgi:hypothetical protein